VTVRRPPSAVRGPLRIGVALIASLAVVAGARAETPLQDPYAPPPPPPRTTPPKPPAANGDGDPLKPPGASGGSVQAGNDFRNKVTFKVDLNHDFLDAQVSRDSYLNSLAFARPGQPQAPGAIDGQVAALAARADYLSSHHVLGTEGLGWSHLRFYYNAFLLHRFESNGGAPSPTFPTAYLTGAQQTAYDVRAGYGEINGFRDRGFWSRAYLRAGRQWRYGAGMATFDGVTLGWAGPTGELSVWGGRRSARFLDNLDPGFVTGLDGKLHLLPLTRVRIDLGFDYLMHVAPVAGGGYATHHLVVLDGQWRTRKGGRLAWALSSYDLAGLRAHVSFAHPVAGSALIKVYYDLKVGRDVVFDYVSGFGPAAFRYFTLPDIEPRSRFGLRWDHQVGSIFEYALYADFNVVHADDTLPVEAKRGWTGRTAFDATYEQLGAILRLNFGGIVTPEAEYRVRLTQRPSEAGLFSDTAQAGESQMHEARADLRLRPARGLSLLAGAVLRVYDFVTRYAPTGQSVTVQGDTTAAATVQIEYWVKRVFQMRLLYEVGRDSAVFAPELGAVNRLYATLGGRF
jgi:hypothetical protein